MKKVTMKIVADENMPLVKELFAPYGEVMQVPGRTLSRDDLVDADVLLVRSVTQVSQELLKDTPVRFVGSATIGTDHVDQPYLAANNIAFANAPGCNANSVVNYVFAALSCLKVDWKTKRVGIIGCGNVGGLLYQTLKRLGVECSCYDPYLDASDNSDLTDLASVLACDIISMHTPLTHSGAHPTFHMIAERELNQLKQGAVLINAGRGAAICNQSLKTTLKNRPDLKVVLDVWESEPSIDLELMALVKLATPHIAGYSVQGKTNGTRMVRDAFLHWLGQPVPEEHVSETSDVIKVSSVFEAVQAVYDIAADDRRMRAALGNSADSAKAFDQLRKQYPPRNEFNCYQLQGPFTAPERAELIALGFQLD